jgi:hypothetical protein
MKAYGGVIARLHTLLNAALDGEEWSGFRPGDFYPPQLLYVERRWVGAAVAQWLRYCATNQKVAGSMSDGVMEFFIDINPSDRTMALGSTQPLAEMSTGSISWG